MNVVVKTLKEYVHHMHVHRNCLGLNGYMVLCILTASNVDFRRYPRSLSTLYRHVGWQVIDISVDSRRLIFDRCTSRSALGQLSSHCWSSVDRVAIAYRAGCPSSIDRGYRSTLDSRMPSVHMILHGTKILGFSPVLAGKYLVALHLDHSRTREILYT